MKRIRWNGVLLLAAGLGLVIGCAGNGGLDSGGVGKDGSGTGSTSGGTLAGYSFLAIGDMEGGSFGSTAVAISDDGSAVIGTGHNGDGRRAFRWTSAEGFQAITGLPGDTDAASVSADGARVFGWTTTNKVVTEAFVWDWFSGMKRLSAMPAGVYAREIGGCSADGSRAALLGSTGKGRQGLIWDTTSVYTVDSSPAPTEFTTMRAMSDDGTIAAGTKNSALGYEAVIWLAGVGAFGIGDLPGGLARSRAYGISGDGLVVVGCGDSASGREAMRWSAETGMVGMSDFGGGVFESQSNASSGDGKRIVGWGSDAGGRAAFVWEKSTGIEYLDRLLLKAGVDLTGYRLVSANGISRDGKKIVGTCINPKGQTEAFVATLP